MNIICHFTPRKTSDYFTEAIFVFFVFFLLSKPEDLKDQYVRMHHLLFHSTNKEGQHINGETANCS